MMEGVRKPKVLTVTFGAMMVTMLFFMPYTSQLHVFANHTTKGAIYWYNW
jgi:hypothetical protein